MSTSPPVIVLDPTRLRDARIQAGLSQRKAAAGAGVARATIHNAEHRAHVPHAEHLARLAHTYSVPLDSLFTHHRDLNTAGGHDGRHTKQPDHDHTGANRNRGPAPHGG